MYLMVDEPWDDEIDIAKTGETYFQSRTETVSVYDADGSIRALAEGARSYYGMETINKLMDRAVRLYIAHLIDENDGLKDFREEYDLYGAIPPESWISDFERGQIEPIEDATETGPIAVATLPVVKSVVLDLVGSDVTKYETQSAFVEGALEWLCNG